MAKQYKSIKPIAYQDGIIAYEDLPLKQVLYPGSYGAFFAFRENNESPIYLCSCSRVALENYIEFRLSDTIPQNTVPERMFVLDSMDFPIDLVR